MSAIYAIECIPSGKKYIGRTMRPFDRWNSHLCALRHDRHENKNLQLAFNEHGEEQFRFKILEELDTVDAVVLSKLESEYIRMAGFDNVYNRRRSAFIQQEVILREEAKSMFTANRFTVDELQKIINFAESLQKRNFPNN